MAICMAGISRNKWDRAFELDPELVFVTGWNEYVAGQWLPEHGWTGNPFSFVDEFDWDHSRDIEPNKGWGDKGECVLPATDRQCKEIQGNASPEKSFCPEDH